MTEADDRVHQMLEFTGDDVLIQEVQGLVREERALVLEQVAEASYTGSSKKPPRVTRFMLEAARRVRDGRA